MQKLMKWIRHNQGMTVSIAICLVLLIWTFGCEAKVDSLLVPDKKVSADELKIEVDSEIARLNQQIDLILRSAELKLAQLAKLDEAKKKLFEFAAITAASGTVNPAGLIAFVGSLIGAGAIVDNLIKDKVIKNRPLQARVVTGNLKVGEAISQKLKDDKVD